MSGARPSRRRGALLLLVLVLVCTSGGRAAGTLVAEYELKAAFLYNFAKYVEWPDDAFSDPTEPFVVGVVGDDPFGSLLDRTLAGKTVRDHPLVIRRFARFADAQRCHLLFVAPAEERQVPTIVQMLADRPVLTVGEGDGFVEQSGIIAFLMEDQKLRFAVNLDAAERANLRISSQLLKLATRVVKREH